MTVQETRYHGVICTLLYVSRCVGVFPMSLQAMCYHRNQPFKSAALLWFGRISSGRKGALWWPGQRGSWLSSLIFSDCLHSWLVLIFHDVFTASTAKPLTIIGLANIFNERGTRSSWPGNYIIIFQPGKVNVMYRLVKS